MKSDHLLPIPIPLQQRWRDARLRIVPVLVFGATLFAISHLWKSHIAAPTLVGQAEPVLANVSSHRPGMLTELSVGRFQTVKAGDLVAQVLVTDPKILSSSLAVVQAEIELLRAEMKPISAQQRTAMDYGQLRLDWMKEHARLAGARVNLQLAETEFHRTEELFKDKIVSQRLYDQARAAQERLRQEVEELTKLVAEGEMSFKSLQLSNSVDISKVTVDPLQAAIAVQESKLRLTEAELSPVMLKAPMDGIVSAIYHRSGEAVTAGESIVAIATLTPVRIVGYLRAPILEEPKIGMLVEVRTRGLRRDVGSARIVEVGSQLESMPLAFLGPLKPAGAELGLPIDISLPANLKIRPGELVDITLLLKSN
jgi:multidrug resistance efflux pump